ncbi:MULTISPECIES: hypothetical protein [unclassified Endozoicomonas]|uniref:hypothetical protein n=1 Tax=unclassified Endozoicomonas TaxID=2644528 RepID=UPI003BB59036
MSRSLKINKLLRRQAELCSSRTFQVSGLAEKYVLDDLPQASRAGTRLSNLLESLDRSHTVTPLAMKYLESENLYALGKLAAGEISFQSFEGLAKVEQTARRSAIDEELKQVRVELQTLKDEEAAEAKKAEAVRRAYERDPRTIARKKAKAESVALREKYDLDFFIDQDDYKQLMTILRNVDDDRRLPEVDLAWLSTREEYFTKELRCRFHANEAIYYEEDFKKTRKPWSAVNACSQYRKAEMASSGDKLLSGIKLTTIKNAKLKSALLHILVSLNTHSGSFEHPGSPTHHPV